MRLVLMMERQERVCQIFCEKDWLQSMGEFNYPE